MNSALYDAEYTSDKFEKRAGHHQHLPHHRAGVRRRPGGPRADQAPLHLLLGSCPHSPIRVTDSLLAEVDALRNDQYWTSCSWVDDHSGVNRGPHHTGPVDGQTLVLPHQVAEPQQHELLLADVRQHAVQQGADLPPAAAGGDGESVDNTFKAMKEAMQARSMKDGTGSMWDNSLFFLRPTMVAPSSTSPRTATCAEGRCCRWRCAAPLRTRACLSASHSLRVRLQGGVRTPAAAGGGWLPSSLRGKSARTLMHESDWHVRATRTPACSRRACLTPYPSPLACTTRNRYPTIAVAAGILPHGSFVAEIDKRDLDHTSWDDPSYTGHDHNRDGTRRVNTNTGVPDSKVFPVSGQSAWYNWLNDITIDGTGDKQQTRTLTVRDDTSRRDTFKDDGSIRERSKRQTSGSSVEDKEAWGAMVAYRAKDGKLIKIVAGMTLGFCTKHYANGCTLWNDLKSSEKTALGLSTFPGYDGWGYDCQWVETYGGGVDFPKGPA